MKCLSWRVMRPELKFAQVSLLTYVGGIEWGKSCAGRLGLGLLTQSSLNNWPFSRAVRLRKCRPRFTWEGWIFIFLFLRWLARPIRLKLCLVCQHLQKWRWPKLAMLCDSLCTHSSSYGSITTSNVPVTSSFSSAMARIKVCYPVTHC